MDHSFHEDSIWQRDSLEKVKFKLHSSDTPRQKTKIEFVVATSPCGSPVLIAILSQEKVTVCRHVCAVVRDLDKCCPDSWRWGAKAHPDCVLRIKIVQLEVRDHDSTVNGLRGASLVSPPFSPALNFFIHHLLLLYFPVDHIRLVWRHKSTCFYLFCFNL